MKDGLYEVPSAKLKAGGEVIGEAHVGLGFRGLLKHYLKRGHDSLSIEALAVREPSADRFKGPSGGRLIIYLCAFLSRLGCFKDKLFIKQHYGREL